MPSYTTKTGHERLERIESSWEANAPSEDKLGDVKLIEIKADKSASDAKREEIALAEAQVKRLKIEYKNMMQASMERCDFVVDAVRGDRRFGADSALYAGFGYVRESERKKGGRRKAKETQNG